MSVLIKGMDMPKRCINCPLCKHIHLVDSPLLIYACGKGMRPIYSHETAEGVDEFCKMQKPNWCPLVELPSAEPVKYEECEYVITKGKAGYHKEYKCSVCGDSFYWTPSEMFPNRFNYCRNCGRKIVKFIDESKG